MAASDEIVLTPLGPGRDAEFAEMLAEYEAAGERGSAYTGDFAIAWQGYAAFYELLARMKAGGYPEPDIVPMDAYFIESQGRILGELTLRHRLSARLEKRGGHIGYKVRPAERGRGIATAALRLGLEKLRRLGVDRALITCNEKNETSARVIEKCGGVRTDDAVTPSGIERRYWISL